MKRVIMGFQGNLGSEQGIFDNIEVIRAFTPVNFEESGLLQHYVSRCTAALRADPARLSERIINALTALALNSPFKDIDQGVYHHEQNPAQNLCLYTMSELYVMTEHMPARRAPLLAGLEKIIATSQDWKVREGAVYSVSILSSSTRAGNAEAFAVLERQAKNNSDAFIRSIARDRLLGATHANQNFLPRVIEALREGTQDIDAAARTAAYGRLTNIIQSAPLPPADIHSLRTFFEQAAQNKTAPGTPVLQDWPGMAAYGLELAVARLARPGMTPPYPIKPE